MKPKRTETERWRAVLASHPEALATDWADTAADLREAGLYVDMGDHGHWQRPADIPLSEYEALRPTAVYLLERMNAAYERELHARGSSIAAWRPLPPLPVASAASASAAPADKYIVERGHHHSGWLAWTDRAGCMLPIRHVGWASDRSDNAFSDDASGLMMLSHAILSDALGTARTFDDEYRADRGEMQLAWRDFYEEMLLIIRAGKRQVILPSTVRAWFASRTPTSTS
jgi:hypothetical protein